MQGRDRLLAALHDAQDRSDRRYISPEDLDDIARRFGISRGEVRGVASYYSLYSQAPRGRHILRTCVSPVCRMLGSLDILDLISRELGVAPGETTADGVFTLETTQCLGCCGTSPVMMVDDRVHGSLTAKRALALLDEVRARDASQAPAAGAAGAGAAVAHARRGEHRIALAYSGRVEPLDIDGYIAAGGYASLRKALSAPPGRIMDELTRASLRGRGGAGFPTGIKERATSDAGGARDAPALYVVCNADEGEPGTWKDRLIMETEPHLLIEGMVVSGLAIGARIGFLYVRGEYLLSLSRLQAALHDAEARGFIGGDVLGSGLPFRIELRAGAGSYLCGEELTLLESLEGKRGYPRIKPPFPAESGLWGAPTLVNNVETLANVPYIVNEGADAYLRLGTPSSPGTKIFCLSGDVRRTGCVEVEMGVPLRTLVEEFGGGVKGGGQPLAVLLGGAAGTFVSGAMLDLPMDFDALRKAGATLGSGAVIVMGSERSLAAVLTGILEFFEHESCGKCVPCRVGTARLARKAAGLAALPAGARAAALDDMCREAETMARTSLCPLGQSPILPLRSLAAHLPGRV
jgi:NADH:ubiquinone oxidoreductase subunit F (NADH-binding)/NADH:ubiquinone oxidoreductase subunit E